MGSDWKNVKLTTITSKITKGTTPSKKDGGFSQTGVNFIKAESSNYNGIMDDSKFAFISNDVHEKFKRSQLAENDILFSMAGAFLGKTAFVEKKHLPANTNQALAIIRICDKNVNAKFIHYYLQQRKIIQFVNNSISQSAQPNINLKQIGNLDILLPPIVEQIKITKILQTIDNKIELNRQTNQTLEQMAQALFKSWFIDFDPVIDNALAAGKTMADFPAPLQAKAQLREKIRNSNEHQTLPDDVLALFPSEFVESELGWVPEGWNISTIDNFCEINPESWTKNNAPKIIQYVDLGNAKNGTILDMIEYNYNEAPSRARRILRKHDIIFGVVRPANKSYAYVNKVGLTGSTGFVVIRAKHKSYRAFSYFSIINEEVVNEYIRIADGAAYPAIKPTDIAQTLCVVPSTSLLNRFEILAGTYLNKIANNEQLNLPFQQLRDLLLPKLISGELKLPEID